MTINVKHQRCMRGEPNATRMTGHAPSPRPSDEMVHIIYGFNPFPGFRWKGWLIIPCEPDISRYAVETDELATCLACILGQFTR